MSAVSFAFMIGGNCLIISSFSVSLIAYSLALCKVLLTSMQEELSLMLSSVATTQSHVNPASSPVLNEQAKTRQMQR